MLDRNSIVAVALAALSLTMAGAPSGVHAHDESEYPDRGAAASSSSAVTSRL